MAWFLLKGFPIKAKGQHGAAQKQRKLLDQHPLRRG
jgi:hypothetical protein